MREADCESEAGDAAAYYEDFEWRGWHFGDAGLGWDGMG